MSSIYDVVSAAEDLWPSAGADTWDRPGLVAGSNVSDCRKVLCSVDVTIEVVEEAIAEGVDLIVSHHPFLLGSEHELTAKSAKGAVLDRAIKNNIALFSAHTNADIVVDGVSDLLGQLLGLAGSRALVALEGQSVVGHGRIGQLAAPTSLLDFSREIARKLPPTAAGVRVAGDPAMYVSTVALCAGSGGSFTEAAFEQGADVYVTSDLRHHSTSDALEMAKAAGREFALVDISHWAAESIWLQTAANQLGQAIHDVKFVVSELRTDPWDFAVTQ